MTSFFFKAAISVDGKMVDLLLSVSFQEMGSKCGRYSLAMDGHEDHLKQR
jgi:hypothetical protein